MIAVFLRAPRSSYRLCADDAADDFLPTTAMTMRNAAVGFQAVSALKSALADEVCKGGAARVTVFSPPPMEETGDSFEELIELCEEAASGCVSITICIVAPLSSAGYAPGSPAAMSALRTSLELVENICLAVLEPSPTALERFMLDDSGVFHCGRRRGGRIAAAAAAVGTAGDDAGAARASGLAVTFQFPAPLAAGWQGAEEGVPRTLRLRARCNILELDDVLKPVRLCGCHRRCLVSAATVMTADDVQRMVAAAERRNVCSVTAKPARPRKLSCTPESSTTVIVVRTAARPAVSPANRWLRTALSLTASALAVMPCWSSPPPRTCELLLAPSTARMMSGGTWRRQLLSRQVVPPVVWLPQSKPPVVLVI